MDNEPIRKVSIIISKGSLEGVYPGLIMANGARMEGKQRLECQMTVHNGKIVYDLNGVSRPDWKSLPKNYTAIGDSRWDGLNPNRQAH